MRRLSSSCLVLLLAAAPFALAEGPLAESRRYVLGSDNHFLGGACTEDASLVVDEPSVGGWCGIVLHASVATVEVVDDLNGHVGFHYHASHAGGAPCRSAGHATSPATLTLPSGCVRLTVQPATGSLAGTITVSS